MYSGVTGKDITKLMGMTLELEDKTRTVSALREALHSARSERETLVEKATQEAEERFEKMNADHKASMSRNLGFIDKLLADKKELSAKVEELVGQLKSTSAKTKKKRGDMEAKHRLELQRVRESVLASERAKRERWEKEKTRELKDITIKGLEPEIQRILEKHKKDVRQLEDHYRHEMRGQKQTLQKQHERALREVKAKLDDEARQAIAAERESAHAREKELLHRHRDELDMKRSSAIKEVEDLEAKHKRELDMLKVKFSDQEKETKARLRDEASEECRRLESALAARERQWTIEKEQWQTRLVAKLHDKSQREESALKARLAEQRDKQIEMVISRLTEERAEDERRIAESHKRAMDDMKSRYEMEVSEARDDAATWMQKFQSLQDRSEQKERDQGNAVERLMAMERQAVQREKKIGELRELVARRDDAIMESEERVRDEYAARLSSLSEKLRSALAENEELKVSHSRDLDSLRAEHEGELDDVHARVRAAMAKKDAIVENLKEELAEAELRVQHTELLLERQRQDLLRDDRN